MSRAARCRRRLLARLLPLLAAGVVVLAVFVVVWWPDGEDAGPIPAVPPAGAVPDPGVDTWAARFGPEVGVPPVALAAYARAQLRIATELPACGLTWTTLAGIGSIESDHGRFRGAELAEDGTSSPPIIGVPLDGAPGLAEVADTDGGRLDGDPRYDRAVGPLQFIPETWARWAADGDRDGTANVFDLDDAALAAARYLCAADRDLTTAEGWAAAVFSYNRSGQYADDVRRSAAGYADASLGG